MTPPYPLHVAKHADELVEIIDHLTRQLWSVRRTLVWDRSSSIARDLDNALASINEPRRRAGLPPIVNTD